MAPELHMRPGSSRPKLIGSGSKHYGVALKQSSESKSTQKAASTPKATEQRVFWISSKPVLLAHPLQRL